MGKDHIYSAQMDKRGQAVSTTRYDRVYFSRMEDIYRDGRSKIKHRCEFYTRGREKRKRAQHDVGVRIRNLLDHSHNENNRIMVRDFDLEMRNKLERSNL